MKHASAQLFLEEVLRDAPKSLRDRNPHVFGPGAPGAEHLEKRFNASRARKLSDLVGREAEDLIVSEYHTRALAQGRARMLKIPTPTKGGQGHRFLCAKLTVDCLGWSLGNPCMAIGEEIKASASPNRLVDLTDPCGPVYLERVKPHQREHLASLDAAGHLAVLTLVFGRVPAARVYCVEWASVCDRTYLAESDCSAWKVTPETYLKRFLEGDG